MGEALEKEVFLKFGMPETIYSDQGTHFTGQEFEEFCRLWSQTWADNTIQSTSQKTMWTIQRDDLWHDCMLSRDLFAMDQSDTERSERIQHECEQCYWFDTEWSCEEREKEDMNYRNG